MGAAYLLVCNAGSSSLKVELFAGERSLLRGSIAGIGRERAELAMAGRAAEPLPRVRDHAAAAALWFDGLASGAYGVRVAARDVAATAHRVVHGGADFTAPTVVDDDVLRRLVTLDDLAPLHNPAAVEVIRSARERFPESATAAVFDTSFFAELPAAARTYALPVQWRSQLRIRRYGFHGIAHEYLYRRYRELVAAQPGRDRVVSFQLGQGCSAAALSNGRPVETSMGYTPLEGLVMGTRSGDVDAGVLLALARAGASWDAIDRGLQHEAGLRGLAGSGDLRQVQADAAAGNPDAALALETFCHRAVKYLGAYAAVLGGLDAVLFGGGIGENAAAVRARICAGVAWLGLTLDARSNAACIGTEGSVAASGSAIDAYVIPVREEAVIARAARALFLQGGAGTT
jgi:acetate kinase